MNTLTESEKFDFLKKIQILSETSPEVLKDISRVLEEVRFRKGAAIIRKGESGDALFIITEGKVRIHDGNHVLSRMEQSEVFGEYSLIDDNTRSASVTAEEECSLLKLKKVDFYNIAAGNTDILRGVLKLHISRMRDMNDLEEKLSKSFLKIRKQKEQIEKQNVSISSQKEQLSQQNYDLTKLNEEKNQLLGMVIHQIKNPLTSSLCMVEMLESDKSSYSEIQTESLDIIRKSLRRINNLINETLDVNSIDSKVFQLKMEAFNLKDVIDELIANYTYVLEQKNIHLKTEIEAVTVDLNKVYFTQIVDNLVSNAVRFTHPGKSIYLSLKDTGKTIVFYIQDEGPGIDNTMLDKIFNQYQRQTPMHSQEESPVGLGLAIVQKYVSAMKGTVTCNNEAGRGAAFKVEFKK